MKKQSCLPVGPLLRAYRDAGLPGKVQLCQLPELGPRFQAILAARDELLAETFLDQASEPAFLTALVRFYEACVPIGLHAATLCRRAGMVRHALSHLLRCPDPLPRKVERCLAPEGHYHVPGLGPAFWSALFQGLDPAGNPDWTPAIEAGLRRLGLARWRGRSRPAQIYAAIGDAYARLRSLSPDLTAMHLDHFLTLVATMQGRALFAGTPLLPDIPALVRQERGRVPLRERLEPRGHALAEARDTIEAGLAIQDGARIGQALSVADPAGHSRAPFHWSLLGETLTLWVGRLWEADDPYEALTRFWKADPIHGAGLWLPAAVLHLKDAEQFAPWPDVARQGYAVLDDANASGALAERYRLFNEGIARLCERYRFHSLEAPGILAALASSTGKASGTDDAPDLEAAHAPARFGGFCADTFRFLSELAEHNNREWMQSQRDRYRFAVREPLVELCQALAERYVQPVLHGVWGWKLVTEARSGRALTSICKNDYGRSVPYHTVLWITFYRAGQDNETTERGKEMQFFVRLDPAGLSYGLCLGSEAREAGQLLRLNVEEHAELLLRALSESGTVADHRLHNTQGDANLTGPEGLRAWVVARGQLLVHKTVPAEAPLLASDDLVGDILLTFDRLLPIYACAVETDPMSILRRRAGGESARGYSESDFSRGTFLSDSWLNRARALLHLKRQLILQGVPGTGKTHVALSLARLLTSGRDRAVRLVQFHPAYSYEEFVEGIKVRSVEVNGRHDVTYPVEDGLLCTFAAEAARHPAEPHVLVIDEINRGNLPRVFGELLYLLEYRERTLVLPYSRREFRLPANLYLIGTMNAADRSVALVDQALRRRFSFLEMPPDPAVLTAWLAAHPPSDGPAFAETVVRLFEKLNARLRADLGPPAQLGHSYFMVPDLDEARLAAVWEHQVEPLLAEHFAAHPGRTSVYDLQELLGRSKAARRKREAAGVPG